jgi:hypothetical protein
MSVLTASGALVTLLAGLLAIAVGRDSALELSWLSVGLATVGLLSFVAATVFVLLMYLPADVDAASGADLERLVDESWADEWEQEVARVLVTYLRSVRAANGALNERIKLAVMFEVGGIAATAFLALSLLEQAAS